MKTVAFFDNKGGVGKTSLMYHLAWMYALLDQNVVAVDLDPQANLTSMFIEDDLLEHLWEREDRRTIYGSLKPLLEGTGDIGSPYLEHVFPGLGLLVGDLKLAAVEEEMARMWSDCLDRKPRAFRIASAFGRISSRAATEIASDLVLVDVGPNLGALNRAALVTADYVVFPLAPDLHSLQGLRNLGPVLGDWREQWAERRDRNPLDSLESPQGSMHPIGYVVMQHALRFDRPIHAYARWMNRIPGVYAQAVTNHPLPQGMTVAHDPNCLAILKHFRSLLPMAQEARKPMFLLKPADGAIGGHTRAVQGCFRDFRRLALTIMDRIGTDE